MAVSFPDTLLDCLVGIHCSCEDPGYCCWCEFFTTEQGLRNTIPAGAREEDIQAILALAREKGMLR